MCKFRIATIFLLFWYVFCQPAWAADDGYSFYTKLGASFLSLSGDVSEETSSGDFSPKIDVDDDLGLGDFELGFYGEMNLRKGRHDFWIQASSWDNDNTSTISRQIEIGDDVFPISVEVDSEISFDVIYARYGYALKTVEEDGYRFGVNASVGYAEFEVDLFGTASGMEGGVEEETPFPGLGMHFEMPLSMLPDVTLQSHASGFYVDVGEVEGWVLDLYLGGVWRPHKNWGAFLGLSLDVADLEIQDFDGDLTLWGLIGGVEFRY